MSTNMSLKKLVTTILLTLFLFLAHDLVAAPKERVISQQQAIAVVKENVGGKVLKVKLKQTPRGSFYKVKLLTKNGRVKQVRVDSSTGEILNNSSSN